MNVLFYRWKAHNASRTIEALKRLGHNVFVYEHTLSGYEIDADFMQDVVFMIHQKHIDCCFTINYIPVLASVADSIGIPYISWTQDAPQYPLYSPTRNYACNYQFIFDKEEYLRLQAGGSTRIYPATLCSDPDFFSRQIKENGPIASDVCFLGTLYNKTDFERIRFKDDYLEGYVEGLMNAQAGLYGCNLIESALTEDMAKEILTLSKDNVPDGYAISNPYAAAYVLERKVTGMERMRYLKAISEHFSLSIYTGSPKENEIKADYRGIADYDTVMPRVFNGAKINLHFAPRNIHSAVSLRVFDVLACGGFLLTTWQPEIVELFEDEKELVLFSEVDEMLDKIEYYLCHDDERKEIAQNGYKKILKDYTYEKVLQGFFDQLH